MTRRSLVLFFLLGTSSAVFAQARPTASRLADAQVGVAFSLGHTDYAPDTFRGVSAWADLDLRPHLGAELAFHQINTPAGDGSYQRTYEIGARYLYAIGPLVPYIRGSYGRGDFNYPYRITDLSYNLLSAGAGADLKIGGSLRLRADYEYQNWFGFTNGGLHPQLATFGIAYHFNGRTRYD